MRYLMFAATALLLLIAGCGQPKLLVKGLTLPPGSVEFGMMEGKHSGAGFPMPMLGEPERSVTVNFNNSAGWDSVAAHIDRCMKKAGYAETMDALSGMTGQKMPGMEDVDFSSMMRTYGKVGGRYVVMLMNNSGMLGGFGGGGAGSTDMPDFGMGDYMLMAMEFKGD